MAYHCYQLRKLSYAIKNSPTIVLPRWYEILKEQGLKSRMMPCDESTCWNSTYDMLDFADDYQKALDIITGDRNMDLRRFVMSPGEWVVAKQLREVLKVCFLYQSFLNYYFLSLSLDFQGRYSFFLACERQHCYGHSCHGPHRLSSCQRNRHWH